uniref:Uncharacterized protein n=1 Tax=Anguilla anguilla TaxID=7936 RepID=A0A0E9XJI6_ANGAN
MGLCKLLREMVSPLADVLLSLTMIISLF